MKGKLTREFIVNLLLLFTINIVVKIVYLFGVEVEVQNTIGTEQYGLFLAFYNLAYLLHFINDPGIHNYNLTTLADHSSDNKIEKLSFHLPRILGAKLVLSVIFTFFLFVTAILLNFSYEYLLLIVVVGINMALTAVFLYLRSNFSGIGRYRIESYLSALDKLFMLVIIGSVLIWKADFTLADFIYSQSVAILLAIVVTLMIMKRVIPSIRPIIAWSHLTDLIRKSYPFGLVLLLMVLYYRMDGLMIERMLPNGAYQAGVYAASFRFLEASNMVVYLVAGLILPMFAAAKSSREVNEIINLSLRIVTILAVSIFVIGTCFRDNWMSIYDTFDDQYSPLLTLHLACFICIAFSYIFGSLITAKQRLMPFIQLLVLGVVINLVLNIWLIPEMGATGAGIATLITQIAMMIGQIFLAYWLYKIEISYSLVVRIFLYSGLFYLTAQYIFYGLYSYWIVNILIAGVFSLLLAIFLGLLRKDMIFAVLKNNAGPIGQENH